MYSLSDYLGVIRLCAKLHETVIFSEYVCTVNGESTTFSLYPSPNPPPAVVQRIRHAPRVSTFVLTTDPALRQHILALLHKKQKRAEEKARRDRMASTDSDGSGTGVGEALPPGDGGPRRKKSGTPPVLVGDGGGVIAGAGADEKKRRGSKLDK